MEDKSCWTCRHQNINSQLTLIGNCMYPAKNNPERNKPVPPEIVDKGCRNWQEKEIVLLDK